MQLSITRRALATMLIAALWMPATFWAAPDGAPLADAASRADLAGVRALLRRGAEVNAAQGDGMTALHWAASKGNAEMVGVLLKAGASVKTTTRIDSATPLHLAAAAGSAPALDGLIAAGADINAVTAPGTTALMLAAAAGSPDAVKVLLAHGANPNARESAKGHTALMFAAAANRTDAVKVLLELGADADAMTTVFDLMDVAMPADRAAAQNAATKAQRDAAEAARRGNPNTRPTIAGVDRGYEDNELVAAQGGLTALHFAARSGHQQTAAALVERGVGVNRLSGGIQASALVFAVVNGHFDVAMYLLGKGADPNLAAENGVTPLYATLNCQWAPQAQYPQPRAYLQQQASHLKMLEALLDKGADPNLRLKKKVWYSGYTQDNSGVDEAGATPFWRAAYANDVEAMRLLLARGADPNIPTMAGRRQGGGANSTLPPLPVGGPGMTPLHAATGAGYLQNYAGNGHRIHPAGWMRGVRYLVEELGADVNARDNEGNTPVHYAASRGDNEMILYLVSKGADVKAVNRSGQTTVDAANGPRQRVQPFPDTIALLEGLGAKNNHKCVSC
jgi:ankyrin repeat protein